MPKTIDAEFDISALPRWARTNADVATLAKNDLAFRCDVCAAATTQMQKFLLREAARRGGKPGQEQ